MNTLHRTFTLFGKMDMTILLISTCYGKKPCPFLFIVISYSYANNRRKMSGSCYISTIITFYDISISTTRRTFYFTFSPLMND